MPVGVMFSSMTSRELTQWAAYEKISGPLGQHYSDDMLANIHEQIQWGNHVLGALYASWTGEDNPVDKPERMKRPNQIFELDPEPDPEVVSLEQLMADIKRK